MKTQTTGTCGACFRPMTLTDAGKVVRHGWMEIGPMRHPGIYGNTQHSGSCFGSGWAPYEVSILCTEMFIGEVLWPRAVGDHRRVEHLKTRPTLIHNGSTRTGEHIGAWKGSYDWTVKLNDGDEESSVLIRTTDKPWLTALHVFPSYERIHKSNTVDAEMHWNGTVRIATKCFEAIEAWTPGMKLETKQAKEKLVHGNKNANGFVIRRGAICNRGIRNPVASENKAEVTCQRCLKWM